MDRLTGRQALVRCATLVPSSHNPPCWKFAVDGASSTILPDFTRRCAVVVAPVQGHPRSSVQAVLV